MKRARSQSRLSQNFIDMLSQQDVLIHGNRRPKSECSLTCPGSMASDLPFKAFSKSEWYCTFGIIGCRILYIISLPLQLLYNGFFITLPRNVALMFEIGRLLLFVYDITWIYNLFQDSCLMVVKRHASDSPTGITRSYNIMFQSCTKVASAHQY